jgi:hypothetical protein
VPADSFVVLTISDIREMPFHGRGGPGSEPMSITFRWTVVLATAMGPGATVRSIRADLRESSSGTSTVVPEARLPPDPFVRAGIPLEIECGTSDFFSSALYPGKWRAHVSVEIVHPSGRVETLGAAFSFR